MWAPISTSFEHHILLLHYWPRVYDLLLSPSMLVYTQKPVPHHRTTAVISARNFINPFNFYVILFIFLFARTKKLKENCYKWMTCIHLQTQVLIDIFQLMSRPRHHCTKKLKYVYLSDRSTWRKFVWTRAFNYLIGTVGRYKKVKSRH